MTSLVGDTDTRKETVCAHDYYEFCCFSKYVTSLLSSEDIIVGILLKDVFSYLGFMREFPECVVLQNSEAFKIE